MSFNRPVHSFSLSVFMGVELLGHQEDVGLALVNTTKVFSKVVVPSHLLLDLSHCQMNI